MDTVKMAINQFMDKQNVAYSYNGILFSCKKEGSTDTWYNMDKPQIHYAKWKKSQTKTVAYSFIRYIYINYPEKVNLERQKAE